MIEQEEVVKVDVRKLEKIGYMVQRRKFWHYAVVSQSGENFLEVVILPDAVVTLDEKQFLYGSKVWLTVEDGRPIAILQR